ncbi:MAG: hypothetical protein A2X36_07170 [Elusimicrobia bacterium GWA2_69_24]|nr:MAG: hypothetical protein A2X36_07170 [Elusimicrobia bacterium GWA2_69_24]HBL15198.1 hypothetical protein [Elusimicrobiota bacterium]
MTTAPGSYFDRAAPDYLAASGRGLWGLVREAEWRALRDRLDLAPDLAVLDAGCGAGYHTLRMRETQGVRIHGIDASPSMIEAYRTHGFAGTLSAIEEFQGERRYDRILLAGVLEFVAEPGRVLESLARGLKTAGKIVCLVPTAGLAGALYRLVHEQWGCPTFIREPDWYFQLARRHELQAGELAAVFPMSSVFSLRRAP